MLESLPQEILLLILEYIEQENAHTIVDLACVCKHLYYRVTPLLFRTLRFSARDISQLAEDVHRTRQILQRVDGFCHVRRLIIDDEARGSIKNIKIQPTSREQALQTLWHRPRMSSAQYNNHFDDNLAKCMEELDNRGDDTMSLQKIYETNDSWKPLVDFVRQLPSLDGLFYDCLHQLPPCLLECLHQNQPRCRLYINHFNLRSLNAHGTDDYEFSLASSPCLYGLTFLRMGLETSSAARWYDDEALESIVGGLAPNLKRLHIMRTRDTHRKIRLEPILPWAGFAQQTFVSKGGKSRGMLECFWPMEWAWLQKEDLEKWENITDFSALKMLKLDVQCFDTVPSEHLAAKCYFPSLEELDIYLGGLRDMRRYDPERVDAINSFLLNLPALSDFKLSGWHPHIAVDTILANHGSRLRHLSLFSVVGRTISLENLRHLVETCQLLETLTIKIKRSRGSHQENIHYQTLGLLPRLRHLNLTLDAFNSLRHEPGSAEYFEPSIDPSFSEFDEGLSSLRIVPGRYIRNGHVRDALINGTLDKELAYNIYQAICSSRHQEKDSRFVPLASMKVGVAGAFQFSFGQHQRYKSPRSIDGIVDYLTRSCYVKRVIGSDGNVKTVVEQEPSPEIPKTSLGREILELDERIEDVFKRLWPSKSPHWWKNWHSFPLAKSVDEEIDWKSR